jgi:hypothetical protein
MAKTTRENKAQILSAPTGKKFLRLQFTDILG